MERSTWRALSKCFLMYSPVAHCSGFAVCQEVSAETDSASVGTPNPSEVLKRIDQLVEQNHQLAAQNQELMNEIESLRGAFALQADAAAMVREARPIVRAAVHSTPKAAPSASANVSVDQDEQKQWGTYTLNQGFKLANTEYGDLSLSIYTYVCYLNQRALHAVIEAILKDPQFSHVYFDISWDEVAKYLVATPESVKIAADLVNRYPDRFLFGTDEVAPTSQEQYLRVYYQYDPLWKSLAQSRKSARAITSASLMMRVKGYAAGNGRTRSPEIQN